MIAETNVQTNLGGAIFLIVLLLFWLVVVLMLCVWLHRLVDRARARYLRRLEKERDESDD
jgi:uncharacterized membrane protein